MDKKDKQMIYELSKNARISLKHLAKKLRLNISTTSYRLNNLIKQGIIFNFHPIIDSAKIGWSGFRIYFNFTGTTPGIEQEIFQWLSNQKEAKIISKCTDAIDGAIITWLENQFIFYDFVNRFKAKYGLYLTNINYFTYLRTYHFNREYLINNKQQASCLTTGNPDNKKIDELDKKIILSLVSNCRKTSVEISKEINVPARTISTRLKRLEKTGIIAGYNININYEKLGVEYYKFNLIFSKNINYSSLLEFAKTLSQTIYVDETLGNFDFELNLEVKNKVEALDIIDKIKKQFGGLKEFTSFQVVKVYKLNFL